MFKNKVLNIVKNIPKGKLMTYKKIAELAGSPRAMRAVGSILAKNYNPEIPCHRVINTNGKIGNYNRGGTTTKKNILISEGINLTNITQHLIN